MIYSFLRLYIICIAIFGWFTHSQGTSSYEVKKYVVNFQVSRASCDILVQEVITYEITEGTFIQMERDLLIDFGKIDSVSIVDSNGENLQFSQHNTLGTSVLTFNFAAPIVAPALVNVNISFWWRNAVLEFAGKNIIQYDAGQDSWQDISPTNFYWNIMFSMPVGRNQISAEDATILSDFALPDNGAYYQATGPIFGPNPTLYFLKYINGCHIRGTSLNKTNLILALVLPIGTFIIVISALCTKCVFSCRKQRAIAAAALAPEPKSIVLKQEMSPGFEKTGNSAA